jgi:lipopolysaccharide transport system ATP-binding protein
VSDLALRVIGAGKRYRKGVEVGRLIDWMRLREGGELFWALRDVSFEVRTGEILGIIGVNGSGKSTLLRILARLTRPNEGRVEIYGSAGSLLDVGTGFHPELTGRENIYLNAALLGMRRAEIVRKFSEIAEFSGVGDFLDTPIKRYSSGMQVRLGFAVAAHLEQEILLVDEVLAVGDTGFRQKSMRKMEEVSQSGRTVVFVGHDMNVISSMCQRALWLEKGRVKMVGEAPLVTHEYVQAVSQTGRIDGYTALPPPPDGSDGAALFMTHVRLLDREGIQIPFVKTGQFIRFAIGFRARAGAIPSDVLTSLTILNSRHQPLAVCQNTCPGDSFTNLPPSGEFQCVFDRLPLMPGSYKLGLSCGVGGETTHHIASAGDFAVLPGDFYPSGILPSPGSGDSLFEYRWSVQGPS